MAAARGLLPGTIGEVEGLEARHFEGGIWEENSAAVLSVWESGLWVLAISIRSPAWRLVRPEGRANSFLRPLYLLCSGAVGFHTLSGIPTISFLPPPVHFC